MNWNSWIVQHFSNLTNNCMGELSINLYQLFCCPYCCKLLFNIMWIEWSSNKISNRSSPDNMLCYPSQYSLEEFQFRWLKIKGIHTTFPILIMLYSNHLKWNQPKSAERASKSFWCCTFIIIFKNSFNIGNSRSGHRLSIAAIAERWKFFPFWNISAINRSECLIRFGWDKFSKTF